MAMIGVPTPAGTAFTSAEIKKYEEATGLPSPFTCTRASLNAPLLFDPGQRWEYGINIDWVGQIVERASGMRLGDYFGDIVVIDDFVELVLEGLALVPADHDVRPVELVEERSWWPWALGGVAGVVIIAVLIRSLRPRP